MMTEVSYMDPKIQELLDKIATAAGTVGEGAARGARFAGRKAGQFWDAGKARVRILELKGDEAFLYNQLGRIMYSVHKGQNAGLEEIEVKIAKLDAIRSELAELEKAGKEKKKCTVCGHELDATDSFCRHCGAAAGSGEDAAPKEPELLSEEAGSFDDIFSEDEK